MHRRQFILASGLSAVGALAGCLGNQSPPPRKSAVVSELAVRDGSLVVDLADDTWVASRYETTQQSIGEAPIERLADASPIGVASAKGSSGGGGGRGATGRGTGGYASAPRTTHGHAWYHGGDYADDWYEENADQVSRYDVRVAAVGIAYLGSAAAIQDDAPGPGPVAWDETIRQPDDTVTYDLASQDGFDREGWYRVGANVVGANVDHDFRWECYDLEIQEPVGSRQPTIEERWKVSPRI